MTRAPEISPWVVAVVTVTVLPASLIEHAGLKDRVAFVGLSQKFQIWDADRYAPVEAERLTRVKAKFLAGRGGDA